LFDKTTTRDGYYLSSYDTFLESSSYSVSDYIPVNSNANYIFSNQQRFINFYNSEKELILYEQNKNNILTPPNTAYIRTTLYTAHKDTLMIVYGTELPDAYLEYNKSVIELNYDCIPVIDTDKINDKSITLSKLADDADGFMLFDR